MKTYNNLKKHGKLRTGYRQRMKILIWVFGVLSLIIVPAFTIYLGSHGNPFKLSLSAIGNRPEIRPVFLAWTFAMCAYFSGIVFALVVLTKNAKARTLRALILVSTWLYKENSFDAWNPRTQNLMNVIMQKRLLTRNYGKYIPKLDFWE